jgi:hypothetical protein
MPAPAGSTEGSTSTSTSTCDALAGTIDRWDCLRPHLLQLWLLEPLHSRVPALKKSAMQGHVTPLPRGP